MSASATADSGLSDLVVVVALAGLAAGVLLLGGGAGPVEWLLAIPFALVLPGYAFVSAVFPESPDSPVSSLRDRHPQAEPGWPVRLAFALTTSVVIVGTIGVVLDATVGVQRVPAIVAMVGVTILFVLIAAVRRSLRPARRRANLLGHLRAQRRPAVLGSSSLQTAVFGLALVALLSAVAFAATTPASEEAYTEFYVLNETEGGNLTTTDLPTSVTAGERTPVYFGLENRERRAMSYDVVVLSQAVGENGTVTDEERAGRFNVRLDRDQSIVVQRNLTLTATGDQRRVLYLLYKNGVPTDPGVANADLALRVWTNVEPRGGSA